MGHCARSLKATGPDSKVNMAPLPAPKLLFPTCLVPEIPVYLLIFHSEMKIYSVNISYIHIFFFSKNESTGLCRLLHKCLTKFLMQLTCHSPKMQVLGNSSLFEHSPDTECDAQISEHRSNCQKKSALKYGLRVSGKKLTATI